MVALKSQFSPAQIAELTARAEETEKQAASTATLSAGHEINEFYLDDPTALFVTNGVAAGDVLEITSGTSPNGSYLVSGLYYPPAVDGIDQEPSETRIIGIGYPTPGTVAYRVLAGSPVQEELGAIAMVNSRLANVDTPELQALNDIYKIYFEKFNNMCQYITAESAYLSGATRYSFAYSFLTDVVTDPTDPAYPDNVLFYAGYTGLAPFTGSSPSFPVGINDFTLPYPGSNSYALNENVGALAEQSAGNPLGAGTSILTVPAYTNALDAEETALLVEQAQLTAMLSEIASNDTTAEAGAYSSLFTAIATEVSTAFLNVSLRLNDIALIRVADRARQHVGGLHNSSYAALLAEIESRRLELATSKYVADFNNARYTWLNLLVNRGFGTLPRIVSNSTTFNINYARTLLLQDEITGHDKLLVP